MLDEYNLKKALNVKIKKTLKTLFWILLIGILSVFVFKVPLYGNILLISSVFGVYLSILVYKDLFRIDSPMVVQKFCDQSDTYNCKDLTYSRKWKILDLIHFSELSLVFFSVQVLAAFLFSFSENFNDYFFIQKILSWLALPVMVLSLFYQKLVEKKWCPLCLSVIALLIFQFVFFNLILLEGLSKPWNSWTFYFLLLTVIFFTWKYFKKVLEDLSVKNAELNFNRRFLLSYKVFKQLLKTDCLSKSNKALLGNIPEDKSLVLSLISELYCEGCKKTHETVQQLLQGKESKIFVDVIFNVDISDETEEDLNIYRNLLQIKLFEGNHLFHSALKDWYQTMNARAWLKKYSRPHDPIHIDELLTKQRNLCISNGYTYTPITLINSCKLPYVYDIMDLRYVLEGLGYVPDE